MTKNRLEARNVGKTYGSVTALDDVSFTVRAGTIHALLGENGAGKSTLIKCLGGLEQPTSGYIAVNGQMERFRGPKDAQSLGISVVQQELALAPNLTLLENLVLGREPGRSAKISWSTARTRAVALSKDIGVVIDWDSLAKDTPVGTQQQVEIIRALYRGSDTLILDEPTAVLAPAQITNLLKLLKSMRSQGKTLILITHKLDEVLEVADELTVLRAGRVVASQSIGNLDVSTLGTLVVGEAVNVTRRSRSTGHNEVTFETKDLTCRKETNGHNMGPFSFQISAGEILGVAGVSGSGQDELVAALLGMSVPSGGTINLSGVNITSQTVAQRRRAGVGYISADRKNEGLSLNSSLAENIACGHHTVKPLGTKIFFSPIQAESLATRLLSQFKVRYRNVNDPAISLSGGNQQKVVIARELSNAPTVLIASQPTRGIDIKGIHDIHVQLVAARDRGCAVLLFSEEMDELLTLADRIMVMYEGTCSQEFEADTPNARRQVGELMLGQGRVDESSH